MNTIFLAILIVLAATFIGAIGALYLKKTSAHIHRSTLFRLFLTPDLYLGGLFYLVSSLLFVSALRFAELSLLYPLTASSYIWIAFFSRKYFGERITRSTWWGIGLIFIGIFLITLGA